MRSRVSRRTVPLVVVPALLAALLTACGGGTAADEGTPAAVEAPTLAALPTPRPVSSPGASFATPRTSSAVSASTAAPAATAGAASSSGSGGADTSGGDTSGGAEGKVYVVEAGDTLATIADKEYGDSTLWRKIFDANKDQIGSDPDAIQVGMKLKVPPKS